MFRLLIATLLFLLSLNSQTDLSVSQSQSYRDIEHDLNVLDKENPLNNIIDKISKPKNDIDNSVKNQEASMEANPTESHENLDSKKVEAYNVNSGKEIGEVAEVAVENAGSLVSCSDDQVLCNELEGEKNEENLASTPTPTLTTTPTNTPFPIIIDPPITPIPFPTGNCGCDNPRLPCPDVYLCKEIY